MIVYRVSVSVNKESGVVFKIRPDDDKFTGRAIVRLGDHPCPHCKRLVDVRALALQAGQSAFDAGAKEVSEQTPPEMLTTEMMRLRSIRQDIAMEQAKLAEVQSRAKVTK